MAPSQLPLITLLPSGLYAMPLIQEECPLMVRAKSPVVVSHRRMEWSQPILTSVSPSGLNATFGLNERPLLLVTVVSSKVNSRSPVSGFQRLAVPNQPPLASVFPSGLNARLLTKSSDSSSVRMCSPVWASHNRTPPTQLPLASVSPSGLYATL